MSVAFEEMIVERGGLRVVWEWLGEGVMGEYDPAKPGDEPRLRFSVDRKVRCASGGDLVVWEGMEDASYCTCLPVDTSEKELLEASSRVLAAARMDSPKRAMEGLSWMNRGDFKKRRKT